LFTVPFTFSHPAAVVPLDYIFKRRLSLTALVIGSMIPDFEYFIRMRVSSTYSHVWPGLFWYDLPLAFIALIAYTWLVKDKLIAHLPAGINRRFSAYQNFRPKYDLLYFIVAIVSILIGAASHILWDSFTHPAGYFVKHHHILKHRVLIANHSVAFYNMLQHISSAVGALIVIYAIYRMPKGECTNADAGRMAKYWGGITIVALIVVAIRLVTGLKAIQYGDVIMSAISGFLIGLIIISVLTHAKKASQ
jgi:hypothetical protein